MSVSRAETKRLSRVCSSCAGVQGRRKEGGGREEGEQGGGGRGRGREREREKQKKREPHLTAPEVELRGLVVVEGVGPLALPHHHHARRHAPVQHGPTYTSNHHLHE